MKAEDAQRLRELLAKATPGPWECCDGPSGYQHRLYGPRRDPVADVIVTRDAALITEAINALPALLALYDAVMAAPELTVREVGGSLIASSLPVMHNLKVGDRVRLVPDCGSGE